MASPSSRILALSTALLFACVPSAFAQGQTDALPEGPAKAVILRACSTCHQPTVIASTPHSADEWDEIVGKMVGLGAQLTDAEQDQVVAYLAQNFGPKPPAPAPTPGGPGAR